MPSRILKFFHQIEDYGGVGKKNCRLPLYAWTILSTSFWKHLYCYIAVFSSSKKLIGMGETLVEIILIRLASLPVKSFQLLLLRDPCFLKHDDTLFTLRRF